MFNFFKSHQKQLDEINWQEMRNRREIDRNVCALISRGNVALQRGEYITREDLDKAQAELENFFFSDKSKW